MTSYSQLQMNKNRLNWWRANFPEGRQSLTIADAAGREVTIAYGEIGTGQPLLLLHGIGSWSYCWRDCIKLLAPSFRVICIDAKGYGFSQGSLPPEIAGHQIVELVRIIEALDIAPVTVAAESLGALTALAVAESYPQLIKRLVVINVPVFLNQLPNWSMQLLSILPLPLVQWVDQKQLIRPLSPLVQQITRLIRQEVTFDPARITDEEIDWLTYPYLNLPGTLTQLATDLQLAAHEIDRLHQQQPNLISTIQQNLNQITCPTLILWADQDRWFDLKDGLRLQAQLPQAQLEILPNCGHVASSNSPEIVSAAILKFCKSAQIDV